MSQWTRDELLGVRDLGPAIIGQEMYEAAQALSFESAEGVFGPAILATEPLTRAPIVSAPSGTPVKSDPDPSSFETLTYQQLRSLAAERGLTFETSPTKAALVEALATADGAR